MMVNYSFAQKLTLSSKKPSFRLETNIETTNFSTSTHHVKTPIIYPQGMEIENPDISNFGLTKAIPSTCFFPTNNFPLPIPSSHAINGVKRRSFTPQ
jgi:hypothetical protein